MKMVRPTIGRRKGGGQRKSCEHCRAGIRCRNCGSGLMPMTAHLSAADIEILLEILEAKDHRYAAGILEVALKRATKTGSRHAASTRLSRMRRKLEQMLEAHRSAGRPAPVVVAEEVDPLDERAEIRRRCLAGELSHEEAIQMLERLGEEA